MKSRLIKHARRGIFSKLFGQGGGTKPETIEFVKKTVDEPKQD